MKLNVAKIKMEMKRLGLTEADLAKELKTSRQNINYILKKGGKTIRVIKRLAQFFKVDEKDLLK